MIALGVAASLLAVSPANSEVLDQDIAPPQRLVPITVPVFDGDRPIGTVAARVNGTGAYRISAAALISILRPVYSAEEFALLEPQVATLGEIGPDEAARLGLPIRFDAQKAALRLDVPANQRGRTEIALAAPGRVPEPDRSRQTPRDFTAYLNTNISVVDNPAFSGSRTSGAVLFEGAVRWGGFAIENSSVLATGGHEDGSLSRQFTRVTRDFPIAGVRVSAGDLFSTSRGFIGSVDVLGVSAVRNVETFDPFQSSRPTGRQSFILNEASNVDIIVNGAVLRQVRLPAGNYDLTNFPLTDGANDVRIEARNDLGQTTAFNFTSFFDSNLLRTGLSQWDFTAGVAATRLSRRIEYDFNDALVSGFYRRGISDALTLGISGRYFRDQWLIGGEATGATALGRFSTDISISQSAGNTGFAVLMTAQPELPDAWEARNRQIDGFIEYRSSEYGDNALFNLGETFRTAIRYGDSFGFERYNFTASLGYSRIGRTGREGPEASLSLAYRYRPDVTLRASTDYRSDAQGEGEAAVRFGLSKSFGYSGRASTSFDTRDSRYLADYAFSNQFGGIGTLTGNASVSGADSQDAVADGFVNYTANRFEASAGYSQVIEGERSSSGGRTTLNLASGLAFAGNQFAVSRPIRDSFAIVRGHPALEGRTIVVSPGRERQGDRARSGPLGPAVVSDLGSYSIARLPYDVTDLPVGYDIGVGSMEFFPPYRSGYLVDIGSARLASAVGVVLDKDGRALGLAVGSASSTTDRGFLPQQIFTNRAGRFSLSGLIQGNTYILDFPDRKLKVQITIPADASGFVNVGEQIGSAD